MGQSSVRSIAMGQSSVRSIAMGQSWVRRDERSSARRQRLGRLPLRESAIDRGVKRMQSNAQEAGSAIVARQEVFVEALHQRPDQ
jgi:hypothetical protein